VVSACLFWMSPCNVGNAKALFAKIASRCGEFRTLDVLIGAKESWSLKRGIEYWGTWWVTFRWDADIIRKDAIQPLALQKRRNIRNHVISTLFSAKTRNVTLKEDEKTLLSILKNASFKTYCVAKDVGTWFFWARKKRIIASKYWKSRLMIWRFTWKRNRYECLI